MKPIDMIAWSTKEGVLTPLKFRLIEDRENPEASKIVIKVHKVLLRKEEKLAGTRTIVYRCQSIMNERERIYELKYEIESCRWFLYKI